MAGVSDLVFRSICLAHGAGLAGSEMLSSDTRLWHTEKSRARLAQHPANAHSHIRHANPSAEHNLQDHITTPGSPVSMQIAGSDPQMMANAAAACVQHGAEIVDINMGCPAKKVCKKLAGSALLKDEKTVASILAAVVSAVDVPVTLKIRTGWDENNKNGLHIAKCAEDLGIAALTVHGRTRACRFNGNAEYDTIASIAQALTIPVIANGDICSADKAKKVLDYTGAQAVMIGRAALGNPWIFAEINQFLESGEASEPPSIQKIADQVQQHIRALHAFYGEQKGLRIARKHFSWYCNNVFAAKGCFSRQYFISERTLSGPANTKKLHKMGNAAQKEYGAKLVATEVKQHEEHHYQTVTKDAIRTFNSQLTLQSQINTTLQYFKWLTTTHEELAA